MFTVLVTGGKGEEVYTAKIMTFLTEAGAATYCDEINKNQAGQKYWQHAQIMEEGLEYEVTQNKTFPR